MNSEMGFSSKLGGLTAPVKCLSDDPRGTRHPGRGTSRQPHLYSVDPTPDPNHDAVNAPSAAKLRGGGAHSPRRASVPCLLPVFPPPRIVNRQSGPERHSARRPNR